MWLWRGEGEVGQEDRTDIGQRGTGDKRSGGGEGKEDAFHDWLHLGNRTERFRKVNYTVQFDLQGGLIECGRLAKGGTPPLRSAES